jgi:catechol 2,3-dioxygenase-like lactoylglutathione lyase family enzyme
MLSYFTIGANDIRQSERFFTAVLGPLGYEKAEHPNALAYTLGTSTIYIVKPFDGRAATAGNGYMQAFKVPTQAGVHEIHAAGIAAGGTDEGAPGYRAIYSDNFYVGYLRDPVGNKFAFFCNAVSRTK